MSTRPVASSDHDIPLRKPNLEFGASIPRHWMNGNAFATHFFNGLNLVFPDGERFFPDEATIEQEKAGARKIIEQFCN